MNNIIIGLPYIITRLISAYETIILIYALLSWFPGAYQSKFGQLITKLVAPFLNVIDRFVPPIMGIGFGPLIAILLLEGLNKIILMVLL
ncbi:membrane protein [Companilactobacillus sp. RD055328]|uniref:YggT family protein n=1 Tax=Companilactobacillus sp. RD055328 TaxID=2916634 RepID=UPI001FC7F27D|nr:YggT family protein [Companilactobacillus sp. RD055328]GKQ42844.1 membrane protein [Companilactobacillus sp. RD055328]